MKKELLHAIHAIHIKNFHYVFIVWLVFCLMGCQPENEYDVDLRKSFVELTITNEKNEPLQGIQIGATAMVGNKAFPFAEKMSDKEGKVCFDNVGASQYVFYHNSEKLGIYPDSLKKVVETGKNYYWNFPLKLEVMPARTGNAILTVVNGEGQPEKGLYVSLFSIKEGVETFISELKTDVRGIVKYYNLPAGRYKVKPGFGSDFTEGEIVAGQTQAWNMSVSLVPVILSREGWSIPYASSVEESNPTRWAAENILDGNINTIWNSSWSQKPRPTHPHVIEIDMGKEVSFSGFVLTNAPLSTGGTPFKGFEMAMSNDRTSWTVVGIFQQEEGYENQYHVMAQRKTARYLRLTTISQWHANPTVTMTLAEFCVFDYQ